MICLHVSSLIWLVRSSLVLFWIVLVLGFFETLAEWFLVNQVREFWFMVIKFLLERIFKVLLENDSISVFEQSLWNTFDLITLLSLAIVDGRESFEEILSSRYLIKLSTLVWITLDVSKLTSLSSSLTSVVLLSGSNLLEDLKFIFLSIMTIFSLFCRYLSVFS